MVLGLSISTIHQNETAIGNSVSLCFIPFPISGGCVTDGQMLVTFRQVKLCTPEIKQTTIHYQAQAKAEQNNP